MISQIEAELPHETGSNTVRILIPQPPSVATPHDFRIEKFVPSFPPVGRSAKRLEQKMVPICSKVLPISGANLRTLIFDFPFSTSALVGDRFACCRDCFELGDFSYIIKSGDWFDLTDHGVAVIR
jgi:hypothetical protein